MKKLVVILMVSLMATSAFAVIDPDDNMVGVYFDLGADTNSLPGIDPFVDFDMYVILTNPTMAAIDAFEFSYNMVGPLVIQNFQNYPAGALDVGGGSAATGNIITGLAEPLVTTEATVLIHWGYLVRGVEALDIFIGPSEPSSVPNGLPVIQEAGGALMSVGLSTGGPDIPVARVNGTGPVAVENATWGGVKSLYR
jgi:hypothetical protein